jgi:hypothetical protein
MKKIAWMMACVLVSLCSHGQGKPGWLDSNQRNRDYPDHLYFTGFAYSEVPRDSSFHEVTERTKNNAQADLSRNIWVKINAVTQNNLSIQTVNGKTDERESFSNTASVTSNTEVAGLKIESYYDAETKLVYAFAIVNKQELTDYYKANIDRCLQQAEAWLSTVVQLEQNKEKAKARAECERVRRLLSDVSDAQKLLMAVGAGDYESLSLDNLNDATTQILARLAQGVYVYVESSEDFLGKPDNRVANMLKTELAANGCSFVEEAAQADFRLRLHTSVRLSSTQGDIVFCYADVEIELYDMHKQKTVYAGEFSQKGGSVTQEKAGRIALEDAAKKITADVIPWVK